MAKCDTCRYDKHCSFQDQIPKDIIIKECNMHKPKEEKY